MKKYTIKDLANGDVAAENDGTIKQIQDVMHLAFPSDGFPVKFDTPIGNSKFFFRSEIDTRWTCGMSTNLPTQSVKDFLEAEWEPQKGDDVLVRDYEDDKWVDAIFIAKIEGCLNPYVTVDCDDESNFREGCSFSIVTWAEMKQLIPKEEPKIELSVMINGDEVNMSFAKSEWDKLMKLND